MEVYMIVTSLAILLLYNGSMAQFVRNGLTFVVTPSEVTMCGDQKTRQIYFDCKVNASISNIYNMELGWKTSGGGNSPIARNIGHEYYSLIIMDRSLSSRITQTHWAGDRLAFRLTNPETADLRNYYCSSAYMSPALGYSEVVVNVHDKTLRTQVPDCTEKNIDGAVTHKASTSHPGASKCPDGGSDRPEALVLSYCSVPEVDKWHPGPRVVDICCMLPPYTPVATFVFGIYLEDERGISGVFLGCTDDGFSMALQLCGHPPMVVNLTKSSGNTFVEDANNYHVLQVAGPLIIG